MEPKMDSKDDDQPINEPVVSKLSKYFRIIKISCYVTIAVSLYILFVCKTVALLTRGKSAPFFPFDMFSKCYVAEDKCPNKNVTFWLYTR